MRDRHYPALDGLRGVAAMMIVIHHFFQFAPNVGGLHSTLDSALRFAWTGVDLFFVLSGFLITGILIDSKGSSHYFRTFYARRTVRIFPLYYTVLVTVLIIWPLIGGMIDVPPRYHFYFWTYTSNFLFSAHGWVGHKLTHFWSLAIEEQFYLVWPFVIFYFNLDRLKRSIPYITAGLVILRSVLLSAGVEFNTLYLVTLTHCDGLLIGAYLAISMRSPMGVNKEIGKPTKTLSLMVAALSIYLATTLYFGFATFTIVSIAYAMIVYQCVNDDQNLWKRIFSSSALRWMGKYSYALYVLHVPIAIAILYTHGHEISSRIGNNTVADITLFVGYLSTCLAAAYLSWHLLEKHFLRLKSYFRYNETTPTAPAVLAKVQ